MRALNEKGRGRLLVIVALGMWRFLGGLSREQAGAELGVPEGTLASRLAAAKRKWRTTWDCIPGR